MKAIRQWLSSFGSVKWFPNGTFAVAPSTPSSSVRIDWSVRWIVIFRRCGSPPGIVRLVPFVLLVFFFDFVTVMYLSSDVVLLVVGVVVACISLWCVGLYGLNFRLFPLTWVGISWPPVSSSGLDGVAVFFSWCVRYSGLAVLLVEVWDLSALS